MIVLVINKPIKVMIILFIIRLLSDHNYTIIILIILIIITE